MKATMIKHGVYWVGGIDWDLRNFHGYLTQRGSTYNAYLIIDEKITLIDNVKQQFTEELIERISEVIDPAKIDYIVQNHIEMDHSGSLPRIMELCPNAEVIASPKGIEGLPKHYFREWNFRAVKSGDTLNLGKRTLHFVQTPMVHWPDNMVSYCPQEKILFSNDAFGQHIASSERFDDEYPFSTLIEEAAKYYANIVLPYSSQVQKALEVVGGLDIEVIAPSHGLIWRDNIPAIIGEYRKWAGNETVPKAIIIYDTMWGSTRKMAGAIRDAFESAGYSIRMCNLQQNHISDIMTEILSARYVCVGSPTLNRNMLPSVAAFLTYMKGLAPRGRHGLAFGSYGWGEQSVKQIDAILNECGFETLEPLRQQYIPTNDNLAAMRDSVLARIPKIT
ncbi:MAG: FprA family A-type flavoprotein [Candidatus Cloacimonetes bacterium]|nr:FprA family A-type flavoprotein [Candidatus Cloacimonadota bacterium]